jgi:hypothetical protein
MGFGLSRGFFGAPFRGWGDEFVGCAAAPRVDAGRRAGAGLAFDLTAAESAGRDALVKAVAAGGGGRRPALRNAPRSATLVSPGSQTARRCCAQSNIVVSLLVRKSFKPSFLSVQSKAGPISSSADCGLTSSYPGERGAPDHYALFVRAGAKATGPILTAAFEAIARLRALAPWSGSKEASVALLLI